MADEALKISNNVLNNYENDLSNNVVDLLLYNANSNQLKLNQKLALECVHKAIRISKKNSYQSGLEKAYIQSSYNHADLGHLDKALELAKLVNNLDKKRRSLKEIIEAKLLLGSILYHKEQLKSAISILDEVLVINNSLKLHRINSVANKYINLSNLKLGYHDRLVSDLNKQLSEVKNKSDCQFIYYLFAMTYNKNGDFKKAEKYVLYLQNLMQPNKNVINRELFEYLEVAIDTNKGLGNLKEVLQLFETYIAVYKTYNQNLNEEEILKTQIVFEIKENEIALKKLKINLQKDKIRIIKNENQKVILILIIIFGLLISLISYFHFVNIKKRNFKLEQQNKIIEQKNIEIRKSNETIKKTFSIISHDLRGPFNVLLGYSNYINENFEELSSEAMKSYISKLNIAAQKNFEFTQQLLSWSLEQQNGIVLIKEYWDFDEVIEKITDILKPLANEKNIEIIYNSNLKNKAIIYFDYNIIFNIVYNILSNSLKYSVSNSLIEIKTYTDDKYIYIETKDYGIGINEDTLQRLNQNTYDYNFFINNKEYQGGFGLSYAKELVNLCGGKLVFKSILDIGTIALFSLPIEKTPNQKL
jgi:signal transduction histidine kinase